MIKPLAWGYLYLMAWFFCQAGYVLALLGRAPDPIENAPRPWSREMMRALGTTQAVPESDCRECPFQILFWPFVNIYVANYGYKDLQMA